MSTPPTLTPQDFVDKWRGATLKERSTYQEHFIDLCRLIGHPTPAEVDPTGENFAFEYGAAKPPAAVALPMCSNAAALRWNTKASTPTWTRRTSNY